jgi:hypothetical protein
MSNRFHSKFHRSNHHTYGIEVNPDTGHDPIASRDLPFRGDFILQGALSAMARLSAYAGYFYSNNTALCAWAGNRGAYVFAADNLGLEIKCLYNTAISARAFNIGVETLSDRIALSAYGKDYGIITGSPNIALSAHGIKIGIDAFSPNFAISAFGGVRGMNVASNDVALSAHGINKAGVFVSPNFALSAYGFVRGMDVASNNIAISAHGINTAGVFASPRFALSAYGFDRGLDVASNNIGISSWGGNAAGIFISDVVALSTNSYNLDGYPNKNDPYFGPNYKSKNVLNNRTGIFTENPLSAFHVTGGSLFDGHVTVTGNLSVRGDLSRFDTYVFVTSSTQIILNNSSNTEPALYVSNTGTNRVVEFYDADSSVTPTRPSFMVDGDSARPGCVGINVGLPNEKLTILGNISAQGNLSATYIHVTPFLGTYNALPNTRAAFTSYVNSYSQVNHQNLFTGNSASSDFIATTDTGTDISGYIDLGINNSTYNQSGYFDIVGANDGYLYTQGGHLGIGTGAAKNIVFFTNGTLLGNERMRIDSSGNINIGDTISGAGAATLKVKGQTDINITGNAATNIGTSTTVSTVTIGNGTGPTTIALNGTTTALGITNINNSGSSNTNIGTSSTATTITVGSSNSTVGINGSTTITGTTIINNSGSSNTNIGTSTNSGAVSIGNSTGKTTITGSQNIITGDIYASSSSLSARQLNLIHTPPNDGTNPSFFIGELGDGTATSITGFTTGYKVTYDESLNKLNFNTSITNQADKTALQFDLAGNVFTPNTTYVDGNSVIDGSIGDARYGQKPIWSKTIVTSTNTSATLSDAIKITLAANTTYYIDVVAACSFSGTSGNTVEANMKYTGSATADNSILLIGRNNVNVSSPGNQRISVGKLAGGGNGLLFPANLIATTATTSTSALIFASGTITTTTAGDLSLQTKLGTSQFSDIIVNIPSSLIRAIPLI